MIQEGLTNNPVGENLETITKSSISLAEAASNYGALKVIFGLFLVIVVLLLLLMIFYIVHSTSKMESIHRASEKTLNYFNQVSNKTIGKDEAQCLLAETLNRSSTLIKYYILRIKWENNIEAGKDIVLSKVSKIVENNFAEINQLLSRFIVDSKPMSMILLREDFLPLKELMSQNIYMKDFTPSNVEQSVELFYNGLKLIYLNKLEA